MNSHGNSPLLGPARLPIVAEAGKTAYQDGSNSFRRRMLDLVEEHRKVLEHCATLAAALADNGGIVPTFALAPPTDQKQEQSQHDRDGDLYVSAGSHLTVPATMPANNEAGGEGTTQSRSSLNSDLLSGEPTDNGEKEAQYLQIEEAKTRLRPIFRTLPNVDRSRRQVATVQRSSMDRRSVHFSHLDIELGGHSFTWRALDPTSTPRLITNIVLFFICIHDTAFVPVDLAWNLPTTQYSHASGIISLSFWVMDMILNFATGYVKDGIVVTDFRRIAIRYLMTSFPFDFLLTSVDLVAMILDSAYQDEAFTKSTKMLRVLRLNKLARATIIFQRSFSRVKLSSSSWTLLGLGSRLVTIVLYMNHLICCIWFWLGDVSADVSFTGASWLGLKSTAADVKFRDLSSEYQYLTSLHWALTQMTPGSMEVTPQNSIERVCNILCLLMGLAVSSLLISQLSAKMVRVQTLNHSRLVEMDLLRRFLSEQAVPRSLSARIQRQVHERASISKPLTFQEIPPLALLPTNLRQDLACAVFAPWFLQHTVFFAWCIWDDALVVTLAARVAELEAYSPDDEIFGRLGEAKRVMCIQAGQGKYEHHLRRSGDAPMAIGDSQKSKPTDEDNSELVGHPNVEVSSGHLFSHVALWCNWTYAGSLSAIGVVELVAMKVEPMVEVLRLRPDILEKSHYYAHTYSLMVSMPEYAPVVDLDIAPARVLMAMPLADRRNFSEVMLFAMEEGMGEASDMLRYGPSIPRPTTNQLKLLREELESGKCILTLGAEGQLLRTVLLCVLKIRNPQGDLLIELATHKKGNLKISAVLPGSKLRDGETAEMAMNRVISNDLPEMEEHLQLLAFKDEEQTKKSNQHGIHTCYLKTTFKMTLKPNGERGRASVHSHTTAGSSSTGGAAAINKLTSSNLSRSLDEMNIIFKDLPNDGEFVLFAWVKPAELGLLSAPSNEAELKAWLKTWMMKRQELSPRSTNIQAKPVGQWVQQL